MSINRRQQRRDPLFVLRCDARDMFRERLLADVLAYIVPADTYDIIIIDCNPSMGILLTNALVAASDVLIPVLAEEFALGGLDDMLDLIRLIHTQINPQLRVLGLLPTMVARNGVSRAILAALHTDYADHAMDSIISRAVEAARSTQQRKPMVGGSNGKLAAQYVAAAQELMLRGCGRVESNFEESETSLETIEESDESSEIETTVEPTEESTETSEVETTEEVTEIVTTEEATEAPTDEPTEASSEEPTENPTEDSSIPVVTEPTATEPVVTEPIVTEPVTTEPVVTEPPVTESVATEPPATDPVVTDPQPTECNHMWQEIYHEAETHDFWWVVCKCGGRFGTVEEWIAHSETSGNAVREHTSWHEERETIVDTPAYSTWVCNNCGETRDTQP